VTAVLLIVGASLVLVTTMVNVWVPVALAASATVTVTLCEPTSPLAGVPARVAVLAPAVWVRVSHDTLVEVMVHESLESLSSSEVVMLYEYAASSSTAVTAVLETLGASLVLVTTMVNVWVPVAPAASATVTVTLCEPTSPSSGMPTRVAVLAPAVWVIVSHDTLVEVMVHESLESLSSSEVVMLYE
jgi:hypothetical protein